MQSTDVLSSTSHGEVLASGGFAHQRRPLIVSDLRGQQVQMPWALAWGAVMLTALRPHREWPLPAVVSPDIPACRVLWQPKSA